MNSDQNWKKPNFFKVLLNFDKKPILLKLFSLTSPQLVKVGFLGKGLIGWATP